MSDFKAKVHQIRACVCVCVCGQTRRWQRCTAVTWPECLIRAAAAAPRSNTTSVCRWCHTTPPPPLSETSRLPHPHRDPSTRRSHTNPHSNQRPIDCARWRYSRRSAGVVRSCVTRPVLTVSGYFTARRYPALSRAYIVRGWRGP